MKTSKIIGNFIFDSIKSHWTLFISAFLLILFSKVLALLLPVYTGRIFDLINSNFQGLTFYNTNIILFCVIWLVAIIISPLQTYSLTKFVQQTLYNHSTKWISIILKKDMNNFDNTQVGKVVHSIERGITAHEKLLGHFTSSLVPIILELILSTVFLLYYKSSLLLLLLLFVLSIHHLIVVRIIRFRREQLNAVNDAEDEVTGEMVEILSNGIIFKIEKSISYALNRISNPFKNYATQSVKLSVSGSIIDTLFYNSANMTLLVTLLFGINSIKHGSMSIGALVTILAISARITSAFNQLLQSLRQFDQFTVDIKGLMSSLNMPNFDRSGQEVKKAQTLTISPYTAQKGKSTFTISEEVRFKAGEKIAIIGPTGKGKTSFLEIISGMSKEARQHVSADNHSLDELSSNAHFDIIRYCPQSSHLVSGKVASSTFHKNELNENEKNIFKQLELDQVFYDGSKSISEKATNISGGEAKRLSLARILNRSGSVNILDEPTTALNNKIKGVVWNLLLTKFKNEILICTTHDYEQLEQFSRIILIDDGKIIHDDVPSVVMNTKEFFALNRRIDD